MQLSNFHGLFYQLWDGFFSPQYSPVDPLEIELHEKTIRSFSSTNTILALQSCFKLTESFKSVAKGVPELFDGVYLAEGGGGGGHNVNGDAWQMHHDSQFVWKPASQNRKKNI